MKLLHPSVIGQPLDGAPDVHDLHFHFHSSLPRCLLSITLPLFLWGPVDCNSGDVVGILVQHLPNAEPLLPGNDGFYVLLLAPS